MKKIKFISALLIFAGLTLTSCSSDDDSTPTPDPTPPSTVSTGDYWPSAINNQWNYEIDDIATTPTKIVSTTTIEGDQYFTFNTITTAGADVVTRLKKKDGNYFFRYEEIASTVSTTSGSEVILLKDYANVGDTWTEDYDQTTDFTNPLFPVVTLHYHTVATILARNVEATVNGTTYPNVIKVRYNQEITGEDSTNLQTNEYWFAKDVGLIKVVNVTAEGTTVQELTSVTLN